MKYRISVRANRDIEVITDSIARDSIVAADELDRRIHEAIEMLAEFPKMGPVRSDVRRPRLLFWGVENYMIAYRREGRRVVVVRVVHGARDFRRLF